jgi:hypothetical protein
LFIEKRLFAFGVMAFALFLLSLVLVPVIGLSEQPQQYRFKTYTDSEGRYEIGYPENWYVNEEPSKEGKDITVQFDYDKPKLSATGEDIAMPSVRIVVRDVLPDEISLERLSDKLVNNASLNPLTTIEESGYTNLSGYTAYSMEYTVQNKISKMMWTIHNDNVYLIEYNANSLDYETHLPTFQLMINTFDIAG